MTQPQQALTLVAETAKELGISNSYLNLVKDVYAKNATDDELALFLRTANRLGLDPTARQIYLVKRWDGGLKREVATPQVSIDGFRVIADRTDKYVPGREATFEYEGEQLKSATAYIKKFVGGEWHEISSTAYYSEYVQKTKEGKPNSMWQKMPHLMLAKCAESLVLRKAFPAELSGIYTSEEMGTPDYQQPSRPTKGEVVEKYKGAPSSASVEIEVDVESEPIEGEVIDDQTPEEKRKEKLAHVQQLCKWLNDHNDDIKWTKTTLKDFIDQMFDVEDGLNSLDFKTLDELIATLTERLGIIQMPEA